MLLILTCKTALCLYCLIDDRGVLFSLFDYDWLATSPPLRKSIAGLRKRWANKVGVSRQTTAKREASG